MPKRKKHVRHTIKGGIVEYSFDVSHLTPGSPCQRCDSMTNNIQCVYADYWLCPTCANWHKTLQNKWNRIREFRGLQPLPKNGG